MLICVISHVCLSNMPVRVCPYWEYVSSLASGYTWRHKAAAAASLSGYQIRQSPNNDQASQISIQKEAERSPNPCTAQQLLRVHTLPAVLTASSRNHKANGKFLFFCLVKTKAKKQLLPWQGDNSNARVTYKFQCVSSTPIWQHI